jgi:tetratricopeptide (TPR) repeat protein
MASESEVERDMLQRLLALGHPSALPKGLMMAAAALGQRDGEGAKAVLALLAGLPLPADQAAAFAQLASDLAAWLLEKHQGEEALAWFERAQAALPLHPSIQVNKAAALVRLGRFSEAKGQLQPFSGNPGALALLGNIAHAEGRLDEARQYFQQAIELDPSRESNRIDLAEVLKDLGLFEAALKALDELDGSDAGLCAKGNIQKAMGDDKQAGLAFARAFAIRPSPGLLVKQALLPPIIPRDEAEIAHFRDRLDQRLKGFIADGLRIDDPEREVGTTLFHLAYHGSNDRALMELAARFFRQATPALSFTAAHITNWRPGKRLRIGFVSRHLNAHTMAKLNRGIIADLDRDRFEVFLFQIGKQDETAAEIARTADRAVHLAGPLDSIRQSIAEARLDILYYPDIGMEPTTYFLAYARLAPVQIVACGHPDTTGLETLDGFISGDPLDLPEAQTHYTEPLIRLPGFPFYMRRPPLGDVLPDRARLNLPEDKHLYVCPQSLFKFHPEFDLMLADILTRDPRGRLVLIEQMHPNLTQRLKTRLGKSIPGLDERLIVLNRLAPRDFMTLLVSADAVLDPWRFGGGSSSLEAFALGVPVVTRPGEYLRERVTMAAYAKMGIDDLVADSAESYAGIAVRLAKDFSWSAGLAHRLREASPSLFLDKAELIRMEDALVESIETKLTRRT